MTKFDYPTKKGRLDWEHYNEEYWLEVFDTSIHIWWFFSLANMQGNFNDQPTQKCFHKAWEKKQ